MTLTTRQVLKSTVIGIIVSGTLCLPLLAAAEEDDSLPPMMGGGMMGPGMMGGGMMGPGMMGGGMMGGMMGPGMMGGGMMGPLAMLNLTDDQRNKIFDLMDKQRKSHWSLRGKIMDEQARLRDLYMANSPDPKKIGAVYDNIAKIQRQIIEDRVAMMNKIQGLLTDEQRAQYRQYRMSGGMMGCGGPGMYGRGMYGRGMMGR